MKPLKFVIPNGSLSERLRMYLAKAGYDTDKPDRKGVCGRSCNGGIEFIERDRRTVALHVARGYDAGITGLDLLINSGVKENLRTVSDLCFSRRTDQPTRWVLATDPVAEAERRKRKANMPSGPQNHVRLGCELPKLAEYLMERLRVSFPYSCWPIVKLEGNEEMALADNFCDIILVVTETERTLRELGLEILPGCERVLVSVPQIIAKPELPPDKEEMLQEIHFALEAVIGGATRVMVKADLPKEAMKGLQLPSEISPTVSPLAREGWIAVEICIPRTDIGPVGLKLERAGARGIVVQDVIAYATGKKK